MNPNNSLLEKLPELQLKRLGDANEAGLLISSLPWPRAPWKELSLGAQPTYCAPLGRWPEEPENTPRRILMIADGNNAAPETLDLQESVAASGAPPTVQMECFARTEAPLLFVENHLARIEWNDKSIGFALGLRTGNEVHWWEACNLVVLRETEHCREIEMGGAIPLQHNGVDMLKKYPGHTSPFLHKHNWLNGHLYLRLHSNGVCEVFAHHINSNFYDDGADLKDAVAVIGIRTFDGVGAPSEFIGEWDGSQTQFALGDIRFDAADAARLATPEQPGNVKEEDGFLVWQPYLGAEVFSGEAAQQLSGDPFLCHAEDRVIPRGVARTVRFSFSLSNRSPHVARYLAPDWWYGYCEELGTRVATSGARRVRR